MEDVESETVESSPVESFETVESSPVETVETVDSSAVLVEKRLTMERNAPPRSTASLNEESTVLQNKRPWKQRRRKHRNNDGNPYVQCRIDDSFVQVYFPEKGSAPSTDLQTSISDHEDPERFEELSDTRHPYNKNPEMVSWKTRRPMQMDQPTSLQLEHVSNTKPHLRDPQTLVCAPNPEKRTQDTESPREACSLWCCGLGELINIIYRRCRS